MSGSSKMLYKFGELHPEQLWELQLQGNASTGSLLPCSFGGGKQLKTF